MQKISKLMGSSSIRSVGVALSMMAAGFAVPSMAQEQEAETAQGREAQSDNVIIVTAQKREQSLQDVPIAITAFGGEELVEKGVTSVVQFENLTPNLRIQQNFGNGVPNFALRGVGSLTDVSTTSSSPVAIHINEVPQPYAVTSTNLLFDLERVEVLRGPQGDLFGLNSTGGTVNFITAKPTDFFEASVLAEYGRWDRYKLEGFISGPIGENVSARLAASYNKRNEGWQRNVDTGEDHGEFEKLGVRGTIFAEFGNFDATLEAHYSRDDSEALGNRLITTSTGTRFFDFGSGQFVDVVTPYTDFDDVGWTLDPVFTPGRSPFIDHEGFGGTLSMNLDLGGVTLTSVSGYENFDRFEFLDHDGTLLALSDQIFLSDLEVWSTELRLSSNSTGPFTWLVGVNYAEDTIDQTTLFDIRDELILEFPGVAGQNPQQDRDVWAIFGHAEYELTDRLTAVLGLRYTEETRSQTERGTFKYGDNTDLVFLLSGGAFSSPGPTPFDRGVLLTDADFSCFVVALPCAPGPAAGFADSLSSNDWSGKIGLNYDVGDDWLVYGSVSRGFKSGGFGDNAQSTSAGLVPYQKETLVAYELGAKGTAFDGRMTLNSAFFYYDYKDQQVAGSIVDPLFGPLVAQVNAPKTEVYGFEIEARLEIVDGLTLSQNVGYTKGTFKDYFAIDDIAVSAQASQPGFTGFTPVFIDRAGSDVGFPEWQLSGSLDYESPYFGNDMQVQIGLDYSYISDETREEIFVGFVDPTETGPLALDGYFLVNARIGLAKEDDWEVVLFADNLFNEKYLNFRGRFDSAYVEAGGEPFSWGIRLRKSFN